MANKSKLYIGNADSFKWLKTTSKNWKEGQDKPYDAIITDPPYNISRKNNFHTLKGRHGIDFGKWDKNFNDTKWIDYIKPLLKKGGNIIIFHSWTRATLIVEALQKNGFIVKDCLRWIKTNPMPRNLKRRYLTDYEYAIWAVKKGPWTFNLPKEGKYLRPEFKHPVVAGKEKRGHPTQKSLKLMEEIIAIHTNPGDTILDPFMGSGTTLEACFNLERNAFGIEIEKKYFDIARLRLAVCNLEKVYEQNETVTQENEKIEAKV